MSNELNKFWGKIILIVQLFVSFGVKSELRDIIIIKAWEKARIGNQNLLKFARMIIDAYIIFFYLMSSILKWVIKMVYEVDIRFDMVESLFEFD